MLMKFRNVTHIYYPLQFGEVWINPAQVRSTRSIRIVVQAEDKSFTDLPGCELHTGSKFAPFIVLENPAGEPTVGAMINEFVKELAEKRKADRLEEQEGFQEC